MCRMFTRPAFRALFTTKRGVERDVDDFLKAYIAMLKRKWCENPFPTLFTAGSRHASAVPRAL